MANLVLIQLRRIIPTRDQHQQDQNKLLDGCEAEAPASKKPDVTTDIPIIMDVHFYSLSLISHHFLSLRMCPTKQQQQQYLNRVS